MVVRRLGWAFMIIIAFCFPMQSALAGADVLKGTIEAYRVISTEDGKEAFVSAEKAHPNDIIEYRLTYENTSSSSLKNISIIDPIPYGMVYISSSAEEPKDGNVTFSIDQGKSYHPWPVMIEIKTPDGEQKLEQAAPEMITNIKWVLADNFDPARKVTVSYRAYVK